MPSRLTDWVAAPVLAELAVEAVQTLFWVGEAGLSQPPNPYPDSIQSTLALTTYCCALGTCSWDDLAERAIFDQNAAQLCAAIKARSKQMRLVCAQHAELLKRCLARVLERVWLFRHGWAKIGASGSVSYLPGLAQARFVTAFRRLFRCEAEKRVRAALQRQVSSMILDSANDSIPVGNQRSFGGAKAEGGRYEGR